MRVDAGGIHLLVRREVAPIFKSFCDEIVAKGYSLDGVADDWGFACREIRNLTPKRASNHSWGLAVDLNATTNAQFSTHGDMPQWVVNLAWEKYRLSWGGNYKTRPDPMHFEFLGTPAEAAMIVASLTSQGDDDMALTPEEHNWLKEVHGAVLGKDSGLYAILKVARDIKALVERIVKKLGA